jgi:adenine deaminase
MKKIMREVTGKIVDIPNRRIFDGIVEINSEGIISSIKEVEKSEMTQYILPGFIDAHIHIESSMVVPYEFAKTALKHGTIATISDPHEIANVLGVEGVEYMLDNAKEAGLKFHFGAPSCVPATTFETAGATIGPDQIRQLLQREDIWYLSEMMNYPGVLHEDKDVMLKIQIAKEVGKPIDGHAPGLKGTDAIKYISAGITTDHECFTYEEALHKVKHGMKILIREGSAAKNYDALHSLIAQYPDQVMFCSDDMHPDELLLGHINRLVVRSLKLGYNLFDVLKIACLNPVDHYKMDVGTLQEGHKADFIIVEDLEKFKILETNINGIQYFDGYSVNLPLKIHPQINKFNISKKSNADFNLAASSDFAPIINAIDGQLVTEKTYEKPTESNGNFISDQETDVLKIVVVNRYFDAPPAIGFIKNMGIKNSAFASTVAHDSHNIICVGTHDALICDCVNAIIEAKGGLAFKSASTEMVIPLPVAGLMSIDSCAEIGKHYERIDKMVKDTGCILKSPFMTLSFMALLVIPKIKISDLGMFDAENFEFYLPS